MGAQPAATIPASSGIYDRLESLTAYVPVRGVFLGERPLSRRDIDRAVALLTAEIDKGSRDTANVSPRLAWARRELQSVVTALGTSQGVQRGRQGVAGVVWRADMVSTRASATRITDNGLGAIDAVSHPFAPGRHGWPTIRGSVATLAPTFLLASGKALAIVAQPNASLTSIRDSGWTSERFLHRAFVRGVTHNVAIHVGAEERLWGQSPLGSMFISGNAQPLPALAVSTDTAIVLPWIFRLAGPFRVTALLADLGATQDPPHARLAGWQAMIQPWTRFELGVAVAAQTGGDGGPRATFLERVIDLFPVIDALAPQHADLQFSNKLAGGNLRLRIPELSGLDLYYELQIDDFDGRRLRSSFVDDAGHLLGARLPMLIEGRQLVARAEWHRNSLRLYEHAQFRSGYTYRQRLIGNPLGPHASASHLTLTWRWSPLKSVAVAVADERRDPSQYTAIVTGDRDRGFSFVRLTNDPDYRQRRTVASVEHPLPVGLLRFSVGHNRAWRSGQTGRSDWAGLLSLISHRLAVF